VRSLLEAIQHVVSTCPQYFIYGDWKFLRRFNGQYLVAQVAYDDQYFETSEGPTYVICPVEELFNACMEIVWRVANNTLSIGGEMEELKEPSPVSKVTVYIEFEHEDGTITKNGFVMDQSTFHIHQSRSVDREKMQPRGLPHVVLSGFFTETVPPPMGILPRENAS